jgi:hypothetical protein
MRRLEHIARERARLVDHIHASRLRLRGDVRQVGADAGMAMLGLAAGKVLARRPWLAALAGVAALAFKVLRWR